MSSIEITDPYTKRWAAEFKSGKRCVDIVLREIADDGIIEILANLDSVIDRVHKATPSGDYSRDDVRRVIDAAIQNEIETSVTEAYWPGSRGKGSTGKPADRDAGNAYVDSLRVTDLRALRDGVWKPGRGGRGPTYCMVAEHLASFEWNIWGDDTVSRAVAKGGTNNDTEV